MLTKQSAEAISGNLLPSTSSNSCELPTEYCSVLERALEDFDQFPDLDWYTSKEHATVVGHPLPSLAHKPERCGFKAEPGPS